MIRHLIQVLKVMWIFFSNSGGLAYFLSSLDFGNPNMRIMLFYFLRRENQRNKLDLLKILLTAFFSFLNPCLDELSMEQADIRLTLNLKFASNTFDIWVAAKMPSMFRIIWLIFLHIIQISSLLEGWAVGWEEEKKWICNDDTELWRERTVVGWMGMCVSSFVAIRLSMPSVA